MKDKKHMIRVVCAFFIPLAVLWCIVVNSPQYLDWKIQYTKQKLRMLWIEDKIQLQILASSFYDEAETKDFRLYYSPYRSDVSEELEQQLRDFEDKAKADFSEIYVGGNTINVYPSGSCVFRCTIEYSRGIYAWVDLVYIPFLSKEEQQWYKGMADGSEQLTEEWYLSVFYGY